MRHFVKISNRGTYTNAKKAQWYVDRELAMPSGYDERGRLIEIQMLDAAELAVIQSAMVREKRVENDDDGIERRYVSEASGSGHIAPEYAIGTKLLDVKVEDGKSTCGVIVKSPGGIETKQLRPIIYVGTGRSVSHSQDSLTRRQYRRDPGRSVLPPAA
jgi:hypothetical protein